MAEDDSIFRQILRDADLYQPSVYDLLTFYHSLETIAEPLDGQFVPMTTVQSYEQERTLIFAVGLIPPSANVTGRLLDRSASVSRLADLDEGPGNETDADFPPPNTVVREGAGLVEGGRLFSKFGQRQNRQESAPRQHQGVDIAAPMGSEVRAADDGTVISVSPDGTRDSYGNTVIIEHDDGSGTLYAHLSGFASGLSVGKRVQGGEVIGFVGRTSAPKVMHDKAHLHFEVFQSVARGGAAKFDGIIANKSRPNRLDPERWLPTKGRAVASKKEEFTPSFEGDGTVNPSWVTSGSANANKAQKSISSTSGTTLDRSNLTDRLSTLQRKMNSQLIAAIEQIAKTPPLRLLVNPRSFRVGHEKIIADSGWGREGPIIEFWGENQDTIEASGKIASFFSLDVATKTGPGLTRTARQFSTSYQNLMSLYLLYKNNGGVYFPDPISQSGKSKNLSVLGSVYIYYDGILYIGSFDNFSITEAEDTPFSLEYSFSFKVRASFLLDHLDDPQYTYRRPQMSNTASPGVGTPTQVGSTGFGEQPDPDVRLPPSIDSLLAGDLGDL